MKPLVVSLFLSLALAAPATPALADAAADRAYLAESREGCKTLPSHDTRTQMECLVDQVMSLDAYLGDIVSETYGFIGEADQDALRKAQADWEQYRASTCAYHAERAGAERAMAELFCVLRLTNARIAEILANEDFADPDGSE